MRITPSLRLNNITTRSISSVSKKTPGVYASARSPFHPPTTTTTTPIRTKLTMSWLAPTSSSQETPNQTPSFPPQPLLPQATKLSSALTSQSTKLALVETACGGLISSTLLAQPGASKFYAGGLTLYTLPSRLSYGGWTPETIASYKGPTTDIVAGLARHVRQELKAEYALAESGTAGPTGGNTRNRTPGYVALAVDCERGTFVREVETGLGGDRTANMLRFAEEALGFLNEVVAGGGGEQKL